LHNIKKRNENNIGEGNNEDEDEKGRNGY